MSKVFTICRLTFIALTLGLLLSALHAHADNSSAIVVDESGSYRKQIRKSRSATRVIDLKGITNNPSSARGKSNALCDIMQDKYYCTNIGLTAVEVTTGEPLGEIIDVAWKGKGEAVTRYLPPDWLSRDATSILEINAQLRGEGFFYIIKGQGRLTFLVECPRVRAESD